MKLYSYSAQNSEGKIVKGSMKAVDVSEFYKSLASQGLLSLSYSEETVAPPKVKTLYRLKAKDLVLFCRKLSTMLASGMSITNSMDIMCTTVENPKLIKIFFNIYESIRGGKSLSAAMAENGEAFPSLLINTIESGEESGNMDLVCTKLAVYYEGQAKIGSKIKSATLYPRILLVLSVGVIIILFAFVMPSVFATFGDMELPLITKIMMGISDFLVIYWYLALGIGLAIVFGSKALLTINLMRYRIDELVLKLPKVGKLINKIYAARFASTLAILYSSGLSLLNAIRLSITVIGNKYIEDKLNIVMEKVSLGHPLSKSLREEKVFDLLLPSMIHIGEESGSLDSILNSVSNFYDEETNNAIEGLLGIMEPCLLIFLSILIGSVLIAVVLPIYAGYGTIGA